MGDRAVTGFILRRLSELRARCSSSHAKLEQRQLRNLAKPALFMSKNVLPWQVVHKIAARTDLLIQCHIVLW
jgi:hypothetical protein